MPPPHRARPKNLAGYLEALSRPVFSAGMSWRVVDAKWSGIRDAFADFDPPTVAAFGPDKIDELMANEAIIRSRPKIEAVVDNAQTLMDFDREHRGFRRYLQSHSDFDSLVSDLSKQFRFIGPTGAYQFLYMVDEEVPSHEDWSKAASKRAKPRARRARA